MEESEEDDDEEESQKEEQRLHPSYFIGGSGVANALGSGEGGEVFLTHTADHAIQAT